MARTSKPIQRMSEEEYLAWHKHMREQYGEQVFELFGLELPRGFESMTPRQQELADNDYQNQLYNLQERMRSVDELTIEELGADFVSEEDWAFLSGRKEFTPSALTYKMFSGKNYPLEYLRSESNIHFHLFLPIRSIVRTDVYETFERLCRRHIPRFWRVVFSFSRGVVPHTQLKKEEVGEGFRPMCSYDILFEKATEKQGCHVIIENTLKTFLKDFVMPTHDLEDPFAETSFGG